MGYTCNSEDMERSTVWCRREMEAYRNRCCNGCCGGNLMPCLASAVRGRGLGVWGLGDRGA
jgi:hypothetical protein